MLFSRMSRSAASGWSRAVGVEGGELFVVGVEGGDLRGDGRGGVVLELGVVLVEADGGAVGGIEVEELVEILVGEGVEGLRGAVGRDALRMRGESGGEGQGKRGEQEGGEAELEGHGIEDSGYESSL